MSIDAGRLMRSLIYVLIVPVGLGQLSRGWVAVRRFAAQRRTVLGVVAQLFILIVILQAAVEVSLKLQSSGGDLLVALGFCLGTHAAALAAGYWSGGLAGFSWGDRVAIAFAGSQKTLPVALFLFYDYFKDKYPLAVVSLAFYHVGQLIVDTFVADWFHGKPGRVAEPLPLT
jgi:sodium/bile acid cotransporter 7